MLAQVTIFNYRNGELLGSVKPEYQNLARGAHNLRGEDPLYHSFWQTTHKREV
jgi:hypothetical protein